MDIKSRRPFPWKVKMKPKKPKTTEITKQQKRFPFFEVAEKKKKKI